MKDLKKSDASEENKEAVNLPEGGGILRRVAGEASPGKMVRTRVTKCVSCKEKVLAVSRNGPGPAENARLKKAVVTIRMSPEEYQKMKDEEAALLFKGDGEYIRFLLSKKLDRIPVIAQEAARLRMEIGRMESDVHRLVSGSAHLEFSNQEKGTLREEVSLIRNLLEKYLERMGQELWQSQDSGT